ncbi:alcohol dehydrogenase GroES-like domain-containing protein [Sodiomyces alkalinus F11]|uniref:Alcohol dehydrogenase GroES-like domain-containing protein n=1 Tax=Sodiomyces alkalinus (strain CBS 110278 / VKM F-3762 / F11) TaxID=1314773 RepID=A0A3N2Q061_SODAK|nr:alcohol dehydrogenase GroES-like domain-containing protein [Sodiomyces alkalinus F11]ROT40154.1 alcohol dehydrogenase GroES-like domain-containing protein [Sodiomyces alkalinus F11]
MSSPPPSTMLAVVFDSPGKVSLQRRPIPTIQDKRDVIVKVDAAGLCGSELHLFRGHEAGGSDFIMGHEFTGTVVEKGRSVQSVQIGDKIIAPFTVSCSECFFCRNGQSSRCVHSVLFGSSTLDGAQAEYVRVPWTDGTVVKALLSLSDAALILMADIWPTGYFGAATAFRMLEETEKSHPPTVAVIGCGPVGLCAIISALEFGPRQLFAIDSVQSRLDLAETLGARGLNFQVEGSRLESHIKDVTDGRGADIVIEVVGSSQALRTAFELVRPFGVLYSIGVHNGEIPFTAAEAYGKNLRLQMGRCPVRSIFSASLALLETKQDALSFMFDRIMPLSSAVEGYQMFNEMKAQKVIFTP